MHLSNIKDIVLNDEGVVTFGIVGNERKYITPTLVALQALFGKQLLSNCFISGSDFALSYVPLKYLLEETIEEEQYNAVNWLIENCQSDGKKHYWENNFSFQYDNQIISAGWVSSLGQAYIILAMLLFFLKTNDDSYRNYCIGALEYLINDIRQGGCTNYINENELWVEEIPDSFSNHMFSTHLIVLVVIDEVQKQLKINQYDAFFKKGMNALLRNLEWFDTGSMSAYGVPRKFFANIFFENKNALNSNSGIFIKELLINDIMAIAEDKREERENSKQGFLENIKNSLKKVISRESDDILPIWNDKNQNLQIEFKDISSFDGYIKMQIEYETDVDTYILLKKNTENGYRELGENFRILMPASERTKIFYVPLRYLQQDSSVKAHRYHISLLASMVNITQNDELKKVLYKFRKYQEIKYTFDFEPKLESLSVVLNTECGLHCKMCDIGIQNKEASIYGFLKGNSRVTRLNKELLVKRCKEAPETMRLVHIVGTEPTLYPELPDLVYKLKKIGKEVLVTTNGINLKNMLIPLLESNVDKILISIDGPAAVHNNIRGREHLFEDIMQILINNRELLLTYKKRNVDIVACCAITPMNYRYISELIRELPKDIITDLWCTHMNYISPLSAKVHNANHPLYKVGASCIHKEMDPCLINPWIMYKEMQKARKLAKEYNINFAEAPTIKDIQGYEDLYHNDFVTVGRNICTAPFRTMEVNADGSCCVMSRCYQLNLGNIQDKKIAELFYSANMDDLRKHIINEEQWLPCKRCCAIM